MGTHSEKYKHNVPPPENSRFLSRRVSSLSTPTNNRPHRKPDCRYVLYTLFCCFANMTLFPVCFYQFYSIVLPYIPALSSFLSSHRCEDLQVRALQQVQKVLASILVYCGIFYIIVTRVTYMLIQGQILKHNFFIFQYLRIIQ